VTNVVVPAALTAPTAAGRCSCCDLPAYSCGVAALDATRATDPKLAEWLADPSAPAGVAPSRPEIGVHVPVGVRVAELRAALAL
jgi:hypothetical protein